MTPSNASHAADEPLWLAGVAAALPGITADQLTSFRVPPGSRARAASVLILLSDGHRGPEVLLLQRASDMRAHPGQVAFPGGGRDSTDADPAATALREAEEETGLDPAGIDVLGVLPALWLPPSNFLVTPVVAWWRHPVAVRAVDPRETASVHGVAVGDLLDPANRGRVHHPSGYVGPAFLVADLLVWGFTAGVLARLFAIFGWERDWDEQRIITLPDDAIAGSLRDLTRSAVTPAAVAPATVSTATVTPAAVPTVSAEPTAMPQSR